MKKKEYMIPQSQVVMLQSHGNLLIVSGEGNSRTVTTSEEAYDSSQGETY